MASCTTHKITIIHPAQHTKLLLSIYQFSSGPPVTRFQLLFTM